MLICPKCQAGLRQVNNSYLCPHNHCYDISSSGYVNLLLANQKHSSQPGDDVDSLMARERFLNGGYYRKLAETICQLFNKYLKENDAVLDCGCGTGYYVNYIAKNSQKKFRYLATDISKKGVTMTAKKLKEACCFVSTIFNLPIEDNSIDGLMSVFCPYSSAEFGRVVKDDGIVIAVTPAQNHLYQLKQIVYDEPYLNMEKGYALDEFDLIETVRVDYQITLTDKAAITDLWKMMPYYHTTSTKDSEKLFSLEEVSTDVSFLVQVFKRRKR
ncbi:MAG: putative RNA methyltransferase [Erysipelotrichaceae bacterium]